MKLEKPLGKSPTILAASLTAILVAAGITVATKSQAFEAGQRWSCVTDQGEQAFLAVSDVSENAVSFSWGTLKNDQSLSVLCNKRDHLSLEEIRQFCKLLGTGYSSGHLRLHQACEK